MPCTTAASTVINTEGLTPAARACYDKMVAASISPACIETFLRQHALLSGGASTLIPESAILPVPPLERLESVEEAHGGSDKDARCAELLSRTVMLKLNGGLGTGMGLSDAKSLLPVKDGKNFLDFTALQVRHLRAHQQQQHQRQLRFMLLNSFSTVDSTRAFLTEHYGDELGGDVFDREVNVMQNQVPKILADTLAPATWERNPREEWCPPGHGDLYTALYGSGRLAELIAQGYEYMFVSNGDNLGATLNADILYYMAEVKKAEFLMEVCERTESDKKGGHLARRRTDTDTDDNNNSAGGSSGGDVLLLRESAQCPPEAEADFQDITKYCYFNTNNLWLSLSALQRVMESNGGTMPLPVIRNEKTVDPTDKASPKVLQLETAMGAAIEQFRSTALVVPRDRFAPVKTNSDLLALRSDAYETTPDSRLVLAACCGGRPPVIDLDARYYKLLAGFERVLLGGGADPSTVPSLRRCRRLVVKGPVRFSPGVSVVGEVIIDNGLAMDESETLVIAEGRELVDETVTPQ